MRIALDKAEEKGKELKEKGKEKADAADKGLLKSKLGGFWKKIKGHEKSEELSESQPDLTGGKGVLDDKDEMCHDN